MYSSNKQKSIKPIFRPASNPDDIDKQQCGIDLTKKAYQRTHN